MWSNSAAQFHPGAWLLWLLAAMLGALLTRDPFYLAITLAAALLVASRLDLPATGGVGTALSEDPSPAARGRGMLLRAVVVLALVVAVLKGLSLHLGATVLFNLPDALPVIGGPITLESLVSAGLDALSLLAVISVFVAFGAGADYYAMLRSAPSFLHQVGLVTSIAITFVPQTVVRFAEIREAQALRGHRVRRVGDLVPLVVPLLAGGLERSVNLAEAMESRGFSRGRGAQRARPVLVQSGLALGLGLVLVGGGMFAFFPGAPWAGWALIIPGLALAGATVRQAGAGSGRTRYRRAIWRDRDTVLAAAALGIIAILLVYKWIAPSALVYDPLAHLRVYAPGFDPVIAFALAALVVPALIAGRANVGLDHRTLSAKESS